MVKWLGTDTEEYPTAPRRMLNWAGSINLHFNDFFCYSSSDSVVLESEDFYWAVPFIEQWGIPGIEAVGCLLCGGPDFLPIEPHRKPDFLAAHAALLALNPKVTRYEE